MYDAHFITGLQVLVLKKFSKSDKIYDKVKLTTANDTLYNGKVNEKLKSFVHKGYSLSRTTDLQEQDRQTFVQNNKDIADPIFSQEK